MEGHRVLVREVGCTKHGTYILYGRSGKVSTQEGPLV